MNNPDREQTERERRGGQVVPFPTTRQGPEAAPGAELEPAPEVLDAELVTEEEYARRVALPVRVRAHRVAQRVATAARSPRAVGAGRAAVRAGVAVGQGFGSWTRRGWDAATLGVYRREIAAAQAAGDRERLADWTTRAEQVRERRHRRWMDLPKLAAGLGIAAGIGLVALVGGVLLVGLLAQVSGAARFLDVIDRVLGAVRWMITVVPLVVGVAVVVAPVLVVVAAWREGRRRGSPPAWAVSPAQREAESAVVTPLGIAQALAHLGIAPLNKALKGGWEVRFDTPPVRVNNRGYQAVVALPMGVTPGMVADKRAVLARNLNRAPLETWPAESDRAGYLDLWVADPGSTEKPAPEYPLLHAGVGDVFAGVPLGVSQRGDVIAPPLVAANMVFGGVMGQGKSNAARVVMLDAALDPLAELWVYVFANNGDFDAYRPRLARYDKGVDNAVCAAALGSLEQLYTEVGRRENRIAELGAKKVTRNLAEQHPDLRPIVALFSECHELFGHEDFGKRAADVATQTLRRARKTAMTLLFDTQSSRADAIPPKIVELVAINVCFMVKSWRSNDGFLGDGSFQAGIRATDLRFNKDRGTAVVTGATAERFEIVKWFFIEVDDDTGYDAATDVITRALDALHPAVPVLGDRPATPVEPVSRDLLLDALAVMQGQDKMRSSEVLTRLRDRWAPAYGTWSAQKLSAELERDGVERRKRSIDGAPGQQVLLASEITTAIDARAGDADPDPDGAR